MNLSPRMRAALAGALLLGEYMALSTTFDAVSVLGRWWPALGQAGRVGPLILAVATAFIVVGGLAQARRGARATSPQGERAWTTLHVGSASFIGPLGLHGVAVAGWFALTAALAARVQPPGVELLVAWMACGLVVLATLMLIAVDVHRLRAMWRPAAPALALGLVVGLGAWGAGLASETLWKLLAGPTLDLVRALLRPFVGAIVYEPADYAVGTETFWIRIAPVCSGYEGLGLISVFVGAYLWLTRDRFQFPRALVLLPLALVATWLVNGVRIAALIGVGTWASPEVALGGFHSKAGWLLYCGVALGTVMLGERWPWVARARSRNIRTEHAGAAGSREVAGHEAGTTDPPTGAYLLPLLAIVATTLVTGLFTVAWNPYYPARVAAGALALWIAHTHLKRTADDLASSKDGLRAVLVGPMQGTSTWRSAWIAPLIGAVTFAVWMLLEPASSAGASSELREGVNSMPPLQRNVWLAFRVVGSVAVIPLAEELAFRGYLLRRLVSPDFARLSPRTFTWTSLLISSLAFGALHQRFVAGTLAGILFAVAMYARGRLGDAVIAHAVTNLLIAGAVLWGGDWGQWG